MTGTPLHGCWVRCQSSMRAAAAELHQGLGGGSPHAPLSRHGLIGLPLSAAEAEAVATAHDRSSPAAAGKPGALREAAPGSATDAAAQLGRT